MRPSVAVEESLRVLGRNIKTARLKRRVPQEVLADRAGIGLSTLTKIEKGNCGVAIGTVAAVIQALGMGLPFSEILTGDSMTQAFEEENLPKRIRSTMKKF